MQIYKYQDGIVPNSCAIIYAFSGYLIALYWCAQDSYILNILSLLLLTHSLIIAAYLLHECLHKSLLNNGKHNICLALSLSWITGACYSEYECLKQKHMRHHANRVDSLAIDHQTFLKRYESIYKVIKVLEWFYIPALELLTHLLSIAAPFLLESRKHQRKRLVSIIALRILFFSMLALWSWKIILIYSLAYLVFIRVLGFMDAFQHVYEVRINLDEEKVLPEFDREYEEAHTWSNLLSKKYQWLNLLVLNFSYHNVHHTRPAEPWHRLPKLHSEKYKGKQAPEVSFKQQLVDFHKYRVKRLLETEENNTDINYGAAGVSFLAGV